MREQRLLDHSAAQCQCSERVMELEAHRVGLCVHMCLHMEKITNHDETELNQERGRGSVLHYAVLCVSADQR